MFTVVSAFHDSAAARRAVELAVERGLSQAAIHLHEDGLPDASNSAALEADEIATGGFVHNFVSLLDGLFASGQDKEGASSYVDAVRRGGSVVVVDARDDAEAGLVEEVMRTAAAARTTRLLVGPQDL